MADTTSIVITATMVRLSSTKNHDITDARFDFFDEPDEVLSEHFESRLSMTDSEIPDSVASDRETLAAHEQRVGGSRDYHDVPNERFENSSWSKSKLDREDSSVDPLPISKYDTSGRSENISDIKHRHS